MGVYDYTLKNIKGEDVSLKEYEGKVLLIVNTAIECGFTPQYEALESIFEKFNEKGFEIIDIPCNQFLGQAPGSDDEIHDFCTRNYHIKFQQMSKADVNGENELPLYTYLKSEKGFEGFTGEKAEMMNGFIPQFDPDFKNNANIKWNFTKFLIDREGNVVKRFEPTLDMAEVEKEIEAII